MTFATSSGGPEMPFRPGEPYSPSNGLANQNVLLVFLSDKLPTHKISDQLAQSLFQQTGEPVVLVRFQAGDGTLPYVTPLDGKATAVDWAPCEVMLQGQLGLPSHLLKTDAGFYRLTLNVKHGLPAPGSIASLMACLDRHFRHVLVEI